MTSNVPAGRRKIIFGLMLLASILSGSILTSYHKQVWHDEFDGVERIILSLKNQPPRTCNKLNWNNAVERVWAGFSNGCHDPSTVPVESIRLLRNDLQELIRTSQVSPGLLRMIWKRIGETSDIAKRLMDNHESDFEEYLGWCEARKENRIRTQNGKMTFYSLLSEHATASFPTAHSPTPMISKATSFQKPTSPPEPRPNTRGTTPINLRQSRSKHPQTS